MGGLGFVEGKRHRCVRHRFPAAMIRLPEEHAKKRNHNDQKDKAPGILTMGHVVVGGQPVGIAHTRSPASEPTSPDIDKDFLNSFGSRLRASHAGVLNRCLRLYGSLARFEVLVKKATPSNERYRPPRRCFPRRSGVGDSCCSGRSTHRRDRQAFAGSLKKTAKGSSTGERSMKYDGTLTSRKRRPYRGMTVLASG